MTIKLSNAARAAIKLALRGKVEKLDTMTKTELLLACADHGIDAAAIAAAANNAAPETQADVIAADDAATAAAAEQDAPASDAAAIDVAAILQAWRDMDTETFQARLNDLAARANKPAEVREVEKVIEVEKIVEVIKPAVSLPAGFHVAQRVGHKLSGELFGDVVKGQHAKLKLALWDHPHAPKPDPFYAWPEKTGLLVAAMFKAHQPVMTWGPKGSGKTSFYRELAARLGRPFFRISCNSQTEASVLVGQRVPAKDGGTEWRDGVLTLSMRTPGAVILIDEVSMLREGVAHILQSVLDDRMMVIDETGETVQAADGVIIGLADNTNGSGDASGAYAGTRMMNAATIDRPEVSVRITHLAPEREAAIVAAKTGCTPQLAGLLCQYANVTRQKGDTGELSEGISTRRVLSWARVLTMGADIMEAAEAAFLDRARPEEVETLRQLIQTHCDPAKIRAAMKGQGDAPAMPQAAAPDATSRTGFAPIND